VAGTSLVYRYLEPQGHICWL